MVETFHHFLAEGEGLWETRRKQPSLPLLTGYLAALDFDFRDLQDALDHLDIEPGASSRRIDKLAKQVDHLALVCEDLGERRMAVLERRTLLSDEIAAEVERLTQRVAALEHRPGELIRPDGVPHPKTPS